MSRSTLFVALVLSTSCALWNAAKDEPRDSGEGEGEGEGDGGGPDGGDGGRECPVGQEPCQGACVDLQNDGANCGACGNGCGEDRSCVSGQCQCNAPLADCDGACVDTSNDGDNCGECMNVCATVATCVTGECLCDDGRERCGDACVDLEEDPLNCGACGNVCPGVLGCLAGRCDCRAETALRPLVDDDDTVALWHMDGEIDAVQVVVDSSRNGLDGTRGDDDGDEPTDPTWRPDSVFSDGRALFFDGGNYVRVPAGSWSLTAFSIELWVKEPAGGAEPGPGTLLEAKGAFSLTLDWAGAATLWILDTAGDSGELEVVELPFGNGWDRWHHVAATFEDSTMRIYLDGVEVGDKVDVALVPATSSEFFMGGDDAGSPSYSGSLDEVRLSSVARTPDEIADHYCPPAE